MNIETLIVDGLFVGGIAAQAWGIWAVFGVGAAAIVVGSEFAAVGAVGAWLRAR